jgi:hypothetical protein
MTPADPQGERRRRSVAACANGQREGQNAEIGVMFHVPLHRSQVCRTALYLSNRRRLALRRIALPGPVTPRVLAASEYWLESHHVIVGKAVSQKTIAAIVVTDSMPNVR